MRHQNATAAKSFDWLTLVLYISLVIIGALMIYASEYNVDEEVFQLTFNSSVGKQLAWIGLSFTAFVAIYLVDDKFWSTFAYPIYFITILMLILVLLVGSTIKGATSWFIFFGFSLQPSEFAKLGTTLAMASFLSYHKTNLKSNKSMLTSIGIFVLPAILIILQPDPGSALVFVSFFILLYREGLNPWIHATMLLIALLFIGALLMPISAMIALLLVLAGVMMLTVLKSKYYVPLLFIGTSLFTIAGLVLGWNREMVILNGVVVLALAGMMVRQSKFRPLFILTPALLLSVGFCYSSRYFFENILKPHQQDRINVWLRPDLSDPRGSLYNVRQSKLAIVAGGFQGKGFLNGTLTKLDYVPAQSTDFIFSTIGEEQGFLGAFGIIALFVLLLYRITVLAERSRTKFGRAYAYGLAGILFIHFFINIGMTIGFMPVIGIPLPLISKGGSSILAFSIMIAILLKQDSRRYQY